MYKEDNILIELRNISKQYNKRNILNSVSFSINEGNIFAIKGDNGKGKSTLLKIILNLVTPDKGDILYYKDNSLIKVNEFVKNVSFTSPYMNLYNDLTLVEMVKFYYKLNNVKFDEERLKYYLDLFDLNKAKNIYIKNYSSGMYQRLRLILSFIIDKEVYFFDEPTSNLDIKGIETFYLLIEKLKNKKTIIIASNEERELELCDISYSLQ